MESLGQRDVLALLEFLRLNYAPRDIREFRSHIIRALPKLAPSDVTGYNEVDVARQRNDDLVHPASALDFPDSDRIFDRHIREHPLIMHHARTRDARVLKISDFLSDARYHRLGLYQDFFRRVGTRYQMAVTLSVRSPVIVGIALNRGRPDYTERERLLLSLVRPHLVQAYDNAVAWTRMKQQLEMAEQGLEHLRAAAVALREDGGLDSIPSAAQKLLEKYFAPRPRSRGLPNLVRSWIRHQRSALGQIQVPRPLVVNRPGERLTVRMVSENGRKFLLLNEETTSIRHQAFLADGLTPREAEVLAWVARGRTNSETATILTISARTVQKHLERVFQKLGVESRTAAAARVWEMIRRGANGSF